MMANLSVINLITLALVTLMIGAAAAQDPAEEAPAQGLDTIAEPASAAELTLLRDALMDAEDFSGALPPAEQAVRYVEQRDGDQARTVAPELNRLAAIHRELGDLDASELAYMRSIEILENSGDQFQVELIEPYLGLAKTYNAGERFAMAAGILDQARHISRRNLGLFNVDQARLIDELTVSHLGLNDTVGAQQLQRQRLELALKTYGRNDEQVVPYRYYLAQYYKRSRMKNHARKQYQRVVELRERNHDELHPSLLRPLREIVRLNLVLGDYEGFEAKRIRKILEAHGNAVEPIEQAHSLATLGDWMMVYSANPLNGQNYYRAAYAALARSDPESPDEFFETPVILDFIPPVTRVDVRSKARLPVAWGELTLEFTVEADGTASGVRVIAAEPAELMESKYIRRIGETRFRPRLIAGEPVATSGVRFSHAFRYFVEK